MADYSFFMMGVFALAAAGVVGAVCILLTIACIIIARKSKQPSSGLMGLILALGSVLTCGLTALPGLVFALVGLRQKAYPKASWTAVILSVGVMVLCVAGTIKFFSRPAGRTDQVVQVTDQILAPYQKALAVDRRTLGFPPLPTNGMVKIDIVDRAHWGYEYPPPNYDVMLHFYENTDRFYPNVSHGVALKRSAEGLKWVHESMLFYGPKRYTTVDGAFNEYISIVCETEQVSFIGTNLQGTAISYSGPDSRLVDQGQFAHNLTIAQVAPILREWGYKYDIDQIQPANGRNGKPAPQPDVLR